MEIQDLLRGAANEAVKTTKEIFGLETTDDLVPFIKFATACRSLSSEAHQELIKPMMAGMFEDLGLDPVEKEEDREACAGMIDFFALSVTDATQLVLKNMQAEMQRKQMAEQAIAQGQGHLLKG